MTKLRVFVDAPIPRNADELDDLNRALIALGQVHGVELGKMTLQWSSSSKQVSVFYATSAVLPVAD
jgi:hypothetical protein